MKSSNACNFQYLGGGGGGGRRINDCIENALSTILGRDLSFNFHSSNLHFFRIVVHILFPVKSFLPEDLEPMLGC